MCKQNNLLLLTRVSLPLKFLHIPLFSMRPPYIEITKLQVRLVFLPCSEPMLVEEVVKK